MIEGIFLGTSGMFPTEKRSQSSIFIRFGTENILFDCGEGTQRQMRIAGISPMKLTRIFISHWHGDHILGLGGIIQSLSASGRTDKLEIYGPPGTSARIEHIIRSFAFDLRFKIQATDIAVKKGIQKIVDEKEFYVQAMPMKHKVTCIGFSFIEKGRRKINMEYVQKEMGITQSPLLGKLQNNKAITFKGKRITPKNATFVTPEKKLTYIPDTGYFAELKKLAKESDLLICESSFGEDFSEKAEEYYHLTASKAAKIAKEAKTKRLYLTHFSQRYTSTKTLEDEARKIFSTATAAFDFMQFEIR
jgi:ribonuclease Z